MMTRIELAILFPILAFCVGSIEAAVATKHFMSSGKRVAVLMGSCSAIAAVLLVVLLQILVTR